MQTSFVIVKKQDPVSSGGKKGVYNSRCPYLRRLRISVHFFGRPELNQKTLSPFKTDKIALRKAIRLEERILLEVVALFACPVSHNEIVTKK